MSLHKNMKHIPAFKIFPDVATFYDGLSIYFGATVTLNP